MQDGYTALMWASMEGHLNVVQCLIEAGANLEAVDKVSSDVLWEYVDVCVHITSLSQYNPSLTVL